MIFSSKEIRCNRCGNVMRPLMEDVLYCEECDNECYLDEEDPDTPGEPMQMIGKYDYCDIYSHDYTLDTDEEYY